MKLTGQTSYQKTMNNYPPIQKPAELAESRLIDAILDGSFPFDSMLPPERELATQLGVTRPTLRETLQRLARDGWIEIHQGKSTRVCNPWQEGNLAVLKHLANHSEHYYPQFVEHLLTVRILLAPAFFQAAVQNNRERVLDLLTDLPDQNTDARTFGAFDWNFLKQMSILSENPVFTLILNGFSNMYLLLAEKYFEQSEARLHSYAFYCDIRQAAKEADDKKAYEICQTVMQESLHYWIKIIR
jgi:GntR family negative regulator for fad regulon and positive regulator of fabA